MQMAVVVKKTVARQLVEKAGVDVEKLLNLLVRNVVRATHLSDCINNTPTTVPTM
jgi:hypothetical protein